MAGLFHAHSGLRFLILIVGVVEVVALALALLQKKPFGKLHRILGAAFAGALHLQVLLGLGMVALGRWYPALIGHVVLMVLAAVVAQASMSLNRRRTTPSTTLPLAGVLVALLCIVAGIMAIGRGPLTMTAM